MGDQLEYVINKKDIDGDNMALSVQNATFFWDFEQKEIALKNINCNFDVGSMTMIIGQTGSGKSALLRSMLGDLNKSDDGHILYYESQIYPKQRISIGYSSQIAWIQNANIRDNILSGKEYDEIFYNQV